MSRVVNNSLMAKIHPVNSVAAYYAYTSFDSASTNEPIFAYRQSQVHNISQDEMT